MESRQRATRPSVRLRAASHLVDGRDPLGSDAGGQSEDGHLLTLHPLRLKTVLPLFDHSGLRVGIIGDPGGGRETRQKGHSSQKCSASVNIDQHLTKLEISLFEYQTQVKVLT